MTTPQVKDALNKQLANWNVLYTKLHHYHWYVTGPEFFTLHVKFEEFYTEAAQYIDDIAERILTIKGKPLASLQAYLKETSLKEAAGTESPSEMVASVRNDFETIIKEASAAIETAESAGDQATADYLTGMIEALEKHVWMLNAYLGQ